MNDKRRTFSYDEKLELLYKTNYVCAHCGKRIGVMTGCTVEHFIPLSKGGTNDKTNLVPLCEECNSGKANAIYPADWYPYLIDEYRDELDDILADYVDDRGAIGRNYFMCTDLVDARSISSRGVVATTHCKRADYCDLDKIYKLYRNYFRKNSIRKTDGEVKSFVSMIFDYGAFYVNCDKDGRVGNIEYSVPIVVVGDDSQISDVQIMYPALKNSSTRLCSVLVDILARIEATISCTVDSDFYFLKVICAKNDDVYNIFKNNLWVSPVYYEKGQVERAILVSTLFDDGLKKKGYSRGYKTALLYQDVRHAMLSQILYTKDFTEYMYNMHMVWVSDSSVIGSGEIINYSFEGFYVDDLYLPAIDIELDKKEGNIIIDSERFKLTAKCSDGKGDPEIDASMNGGIVPTYAIVCQAINHLVEDCMGES